MLKILQKYNYPYLNNIASKYQYMSDFFENDAECYFWCVYRNFDIILDNIKRDDVYTILSHEELKNMIVEKLFNFQTFKPTIIPIQY